jgi:hypothetical protein
MKLLLSWAAWFKAQLRMSGHVSRKHHGEPCFGMDTSPLHMLPSDLSAVSLLLYTQGASTCTQKCSFIILRRSFPYQIKGGTVS